MGGGGLSHDVAVVAVAVEVPPSDGEVGCGGGLSGENGLEKEALRVDNPAYGAADVSSLSVEIFR